MKKLEKKIPQTAHSTSTINLIDPTVKEMLDKDFRKSILKIAKELREDLRNKLRKYRK